MNDPVTAIFAFFIGTLVVYRVTTMLVLEYGVGGMFEKIRKLAGVYEKTVQRPNAIGQLTDVTVNDADNIIGEILTCFYCCSVWVSLPVAAVVCYLVGDSALPYWLSYTGLWFALSGGAIVWKGIA